MRSLLLCLVLSLASLFTLSGCQVAVTPLQPQPCAEGFYWSPGYGCVAFPPYAPYAVVNTNFLNLRSCPSTQCGVIASLNLGEQVQILGAESGWTQVWAYGRGQVGWVASRYLN